MKYSRLFQISVGGVLLLLQLYYLSSIVSPLPPDPVRVTKTISLGLDGIRRFLVVFCLFIFWLLVFLHDRNKASSNKKNLKMTVGFLITALLVIAVNFFVNPKGLYPIHWVEARVEDSRKIKAENYEKSSKSHQIIILGSSRAYSFSPTYIQDRLHFSAFNFAVLNGRISDFIIINNYVFDRAKVKPELLIVEVNPVTSFIPEIGLENTSSEFLPYMDPMWVLQYYVIRVRGLISVEHFSDAVYTFFYRLKFPESQMPWLEWEVFADGGAIRPVNPYFEEIISFWNSTAAPVCPAQDLKLQALYLEQLVQNARANGTAVIFVMTPWQPDYYRSVLADSEAYKQCVGAYDDIFTRLQSQYDGVYYRDYSDLFDVKGDKTYLGFYDYQHITPINANHIIDAIADTINEVMEEKP